MNASEPIIEINNDLPNSEGVGFLYNSENQLVGRIENYYAFLNVRVQIRKKKLEGFYMIRKNVKTFFNSDGTVMFYPDYNLIDSLLDNLLVDF